MEWSNRAGIAQTALDIEFWNGQINLYNIETPCPNGECNTIFHYWWMAHAVDALADGYLRTRDKGYVYRLEQLYDGLLKRNGGAFPNELYDDMEWMAIAWLRAYGATGINRFKEAALILWEDIRTGWNDHMGGGIAWQKSQLDYKNTPANAPAVILAARLYRQFGREEDLSWALRIYEWQKEKLVDPDSGFVWDGMNRTGDGSIDKDWKFTYCQGVYIGASVELFRITKDEGYLRDAIRTADAARAELTDAATGLLPDEGDGDGGLFKGILVRYLGELAKEAPGRSAAEEMLLANATSLWDQGRDAGRQLFHTDWGSPPPERVTLSTQLSAIMLLERAAELERSGLLKAKSA
ncbi:glycoside hydrolase family 76 protein [Paenibacillus sp. LHD-117]|uniref:glycoside hydrolase family 76 protein n=1 Tax=Paenibacillus sp. LHD-117 TaxID=3071412 RepID=UPI0027DF5AF6|nr:glycoside hydrolase family 76 protein [Paenibacillus sp. LHD-117]MDQ6419735.1 glycoside hydrolase family 76 protein [Paenibacillus sp. LHD-117]